MKALACLLVFILSLRSFTIGQDEDLARDPSCQYPYYGEDCEKEFCQDYNPCTVHGHCQMLGFEPGWVCQCKKSNYMWHGTFCEKESCQPDKCLNNGTCRGTPYRPYYRCECYYPYYGDSCEKAICDEVTGINPCLNGAKCIPQGMEPGYRCQCAEGFHGIDCELSDCDGRDPCRNGGTCRHIGERGVECECRDGYLGRFCEKELCVDVNPCMNDAECAPIRSAPGYRCHCPTGYNGTECQHIVEEKLTPPPPDRSAFAIVSVVFILIIISAASFAAVCVMKRRRRLMRPPSPPPMRYMSDSVFGIESEPIYDEIRDKS